MSGVFAWGKKQRNCFGRFFLSFLRNLKQILRFEFDWCSSAKTLIMSNLKAFTEGVTNEIKSAIDDAISTLYFNLVLVFKSLINSFALAS
jgi:hypothetical protein